jgi:cysteinyl-tRNA synthetase
MVQAAGAPEDPVPAAAAGARDVFRAALEDDFNTPQALGALFTLARELNAARARLERAPEAGGLAALRAGLGTLEELANVLGIGLRGAGPNPPPIAPQDARLIALRDLLASRPDLGGIDDLLGKGGVAEAARWVDRAVSVFRAEARQRKEWAFADRLRDLLRELGVEVKDTPQGPRWDLQA